MKQPLISPKTKQESSPADSFVGPDTLSIINVEPQQKEDASMLKIILLVNAGSLVYTALQTLTKDMLSYRGVTIFEFVFFRSFFNMCASAVIVKQQK